MATTASARPPHLPPSPFSYSHSHFRSPSTPRSTSATPPPRTFSPAPSQSPTRLRDQLEFQQKERDNLLWQARWKSYEDRKAAWLQSSWAEYEKRKETDSNARWKEYEEMKRDMMDKWAGMDLNGGRVNSPEPVKSSRSTEYFTAAPSRSAIAPTPVRAASISRSARSSAPSTPPPTYKTSTAPSTPARQSTLRTAATSPVPPPHFSSATLSPQPSTPKLFFPAPPIRARSNTNPTSTTSKPQIFMPKPVPASDNDLSRKANALLAEERRRRLADEQRRMEQAAEPARRKREEERRLEEERRHASEKAPWEPEPAAKKQPKAAETRRRPTPESLKEEHRRRLAEAQAAETIRLQRSYTILERQHQLVRSAWENYEESWKALYEGKVTGPLTLTNIPWPVVGPIRSVNELDRGRMEGFLLWEGIDGQSGGKAMKQRVRDAMLRFHPDRFEGRWMAHVREADRPAVTEGVGRVVRFLNEISSQLA